MTKFNPIVKSSISKLTKLSDIGFIVTCAYKDFNESKVSKGALDLHGTGLGGELIVSSKLVLGDGLEQLSETNLQGALRSQVIKSKDIHIIEVSLDLDGLSGKSEGFSLEDVKGTSEGVFGLSELLKSKLSISGTTYTLNDITGKEFRFSYFRCHLHSFLIHTKEILDKSTELINEHKDLKSEINISPIIIFKCGLTWSNLISLMQLHNISVHGGSISRRHKVSITEYRLSTFLYLSGLTGSIEDFYDTYVDKFFSSPSLVPDLYGYKYLHNNLIGYRPQTKNVLLNYLLLNKQIKTLIELEQVNKNIFTLEKSLEGLNDLINTDFSEELSSLERFKEQNLKRLSELKSKDLSSSSSKHKAVVRHKIRTIKSNISSITDQILELSHSLSADQLTKIESLEKLSILKTKLLSLEQNLQDISLEFESISKVGADKTISLLPVTSYLTRSQTRKYHSLNLKRDYSTKTRSGSSPMVHNLSFEINSPAFTELVRFLTNFPVTEETQIQLEKYLLNQGELFYKTKLEEVLDINYYKLNPSVLNIVKSSLSDLDKLITNYKNNVVNSKQYGKEIHLVLTSLDNKLIIGYLLGRVLKIISNHKQVNKKTISVNVAIDLAKDLVNYFISNEFKKFMVQMSKTKVTEINKSKNKYTLSKFVSEHTEFDILYTDVLLFTLGINLLNFLEEVKLIKTTVVQLEKDVKQTILTADTKIEVLLSKYHLLDVPYKIPMIVPPKKYSIDEKTGEVILGGYLLNDVSYVNPLIIPNSNLKHQSTINKDQEAIISMINYISSVGFKINRDVLDFILAKGVELNLIKDPNLTHDLELKSKTSKLTISDSKKLDSFISTKRLELNILGLAQILKNLSEFFIPVRLDNRGRVYCASEYLHYQSTELAKALLLFSKSEKISKSDKKALDYLKIFGANCFGNGLDKKSYADRINWIDLNEVNILNFKNGALLSQADSKLLFLAFCFEYCKFKQSLLDDKSYYLTDFPIQFDATCNGYQHLALLTGNDSMMQNLNLHDIEDNQGPKDFYTYLSLKLKDYFAKQIKEYRDKQINPENLSSFKTLIDLPIKRKMIKSAFMVKPYNASGFQVVNYLKEHFEETKINGKTYFISNDDHNFKLTNNEFYLLANSMDAVLYNEHPKLKSIICYLKKIAEICSKLEISIVWTAPSGLQINQYYIDSEAIRLKPFSYKNASYSLSIGTKKLNKSKQIRALMPNLIHSLDSATLALLVNMLFKENKFHNFYSIHDCFAVTANNVERLIYELKMVYIYIYCDNGYLLKFDKGIIENIKSHYGETAFNEQTKKILVNNIKLDYPNVQEAVYGKIAPNYINSPYLVN